MDMQAPEKASAAEAAGWEARMRGDRDMPPKEFRSDRESFNGWLRGWDMANGRVKYAAYKGRR